MPTRLRIGCEEEYGYAEAGKAGRSWDLAPCDRSGDRETEDRERPNEPQGIGVPAIMRLP
jgi:hypothetical protein